MRQRLVFGLLALSLLALPVTAAAQHRQPHGGAFAIGGDAGVYVPGSEFHAGFNPDAFVEFYPTSRVSVRAMGAYTSPNFDNDTDELRQVRGSLNISYNWEADLWHPFVTAGVDGFLIQPRSAGENVGDSEARVGANVGIGIEYFARPQVTFKLEATYHYATRGDLPGSPSGIALTVGMKKYF
jgi:opacity protein-like surface antigen